MKNSFSLLRIITLVIFLGASAQIYGQRVVVRRADGTSTIQEGRQRRQAHKTYPIAIKLAASEILYGNYMVNGEYRFIDDFTIGGGLGITSQEGNYLASVMEVNGMYKGGSNGTGFSFNIEPRYYNDDALEDNAMFYGIGFMRRSYNVLREDSYDPYPEEISAVYSDLYLSYGTSIIIGDVVVLEGFISGGIRFINGEIYNRSTSQVNDIEDGTYFVKFGLSLGYVFNN